MAKETYEAFRERIFGTPYLVWHDGPDGSALRSLKGEEKEQAFELLLEGLAEGDHVAVEGLSLLDPARALPYIREAYDGAQQKLPRVALADFLRQHDPNANLEKLGNSIVSTLQQNNLFSIDAIIALKHFPTPSVIDTLLFVVEHHAEYLLRYHAANSLLSLAHQPGIESQHELFAFLRNGNSDEPTPEDRIRYKQAADILRQMVAQPTASNSHNSP